MKINDENDCLLSLCYCYADNCGCRCGSKGCLFQTSKEWSLHSDGSVEAPSCWLVRDMREQVFFFPLFLPSFDSFYESESIYACFVG